MDLEKQTSIHEVLTRLESEGRLTPDDTIEEARDPASPLHSEFTWDLKQAATMTWRQQARAIISQFRISITVQRKTYSVQEFVEAPGKPEREQGYVAFTKIKNSKDLAREFLDRELGIASSYVSKTRDYARVLGLEKSVNRVVDDIASLRQKAQNRKPADKHARRATA